ncbi:YihY/virulence factor BrkB family protein [Ilumatobacter nonamiensis]|uniref:YihY/virulence factor BrkB family protein n=1 Tax=Ilumatobacter nonamiensis TaxID=467093 RepID=UPI0005907AAA|nr:YihY/virulence factor BrkB family protein [Ilumatobacter nonamiensis]
METYGEWRSHRTMRLGAGLAYYGLFAIVPLVSISLAVAGLVVDQADVNELVSSILSNVFDTDASEFSSEVSQTIDSGSTASGLGVFGLVSLLLTASLVFVALQDAFDTIWEVPVPRGTWSSMRRRFLAFAVVFLAGAVLIVSFAVVSISNLIRSFVPGDHALIDVAADVLATVSSGAILAAVIAMLFHYLTAHRLTWRVSAVGGIATALVLTIGNRLFVEYMRRYGVSSLVGVTGSILAGIVWLYAIAQIVLAGAELTRTLQSRLPVRFR